MNYSDFLLKCFRDGTINEELKIQILRQKFLKDSQHEAETVRLEQDRVFHTCHRLPQRYY